MRLIDNEERPEISVCVFTKAWNHSTGPYAQSLANALAVAGLTVYLIAPPAQPTSFEATHKSVVRKRPPRQLDFDSPRLARFFASFKRAALGCWYVAQCRMKTGLFITSIPEPMLFTLPLFCYLRITGAKLIYIVHDPVPHAWSFPPPLRFVETFFIWCSYLLATELVVLSSPTAEALSSKFGIAKEKITVIPAGASPRRFHPVQGTRRLLVFGVFRKKKRILESILGVVEARERGIDCSLLIAGSYSRHEKEYGQAVEALAREHEQVISIRVGYVPEEGIDDLADECDAFLLPYEDYDSHSGVALAAGLLGRPVIATAVGGLPFLFELGLQGEKLDSASPNDIADAISRFFNTDRDTWSLILERGRQQLLKSLHWNNVAAKFCSLL